MHLSSHHPVIAQARLRMSHGMLMLILVLACAAPTACAQQNISSSDKNGAMTESADEISANLDEVKETRIDPFARGPLATILDGWNDLWTWTDESFGFTMGTAYTTLAQAATSGDYSQDRYGISGDLDLFGRWRLFHTEVHKGLLNAGQFAFKVEYRNRFTRYSPSDLGDTIGSLWGTTRGFSNRGLSLREVWWQQRLLNDKIAIRLGRINTKNTFDVYRFNNANHFFLNQAFSDNPTIAFPKNGLGGTISISPDDHWFLIYGFADANGRATEQAGFDSDNVDEWFQAATAGWTGDVGDLGTGRYQLTLWHTEGREQSMLPSASGISMVLQQELGNGWVPFSRYSWSSDAAVDTRQLVTAGAVLEAPFDRKDDRLGLAAGWGQPHDSSLRNQWVGEIFYRTEVFSELRLTPSAQILVNPSNNRNDKVIGIFGLRARLTF